MTLEAGFGSALITPPTPVALAGFGGPQLATEVHDDLEARAVLLRAGLWPLWQGYLPVPFAPGGYEEGVSYGAEAVQAILDALLEVPA